MKCLGRRLFKFAATVSATLFVGAAVLWARNYRHSDFVHLTISTPTLLPITSEAQREAQEQVRQTQGWAGVYTSRYIATAAAKGHWYFLEGRDAESVRDVSRPPPRFRYGSDSSGFLLPDASITALERSGLPGFTISHKNWAGFSFLHLKFGAYSDTRRVGVPMWAACALLLAMPTVWAWHWFRSQRGLRRGLCANCGYDLRATPDRCPECGAMVSSASPHS